jgi:hypothetical protein
MIQNKYEQQKPFLDPTKINPKPPEKERKKERKKESFVELLEFYFKFILILHRVNN